MMHSVLILFIAAIPLKTTLGYNVGTSPNISVINRRPLPVSYNFTQAIPIEQNDVSDTHISHNDNDFTSDTIPDDDKRLIFENIPEIKDNTKDINNYDFHTQTKAAGDDELIDDKLLKPSPKRFNTMFKNYMLKEIKEDVSQKSNPFKQDNIIFIYKSDLEPPESGNSLIHSDFTIDEDHKNESKPKDSDVDDSILLDDYNDVTYHNANEMVDYVSKNAYFLFVKI